MSISPVASSSVASTNIQTLRDQLLQQLNNTASGSQDLSGSSSALGDLLTLSPAAQQLTQAPAAVTQAMNDLLSSQNDVQGDLSHLKAYFKQNPNSLAAVLSSLQGSSSINGNSSTGANSALLTALMNHQSNASNSSALLGLFGSQGQSSLFSFMSDATNNSTNGSNSIFG